MNKNKNRGRLRKIWEAGSLGKAMGIIGIYFCQGFHLELPGIPWPLGSFKSLKGPWVLVRPLGPCKAIIVFMRPWKITETRESQGKLVGAGLGVCPLPL